MAITTLPTFEDDEILSAGKLNELRDAIEDKFTGAITGADLAWPLVAQGNLDMAGFSVLGVKNFRSIYDSTQYASLQAAIDAAEVAGGGVVLIPSGTEYEVQGLTIESDNVALVGQGDDSVLKLTTGATAGQLLNVASQVEGVRIIGIKFDGNTGTGSGQEAIRLQRTINTKIIDCTFDDFSGNCIYVTNGGSAGNASTDVEVRDCRFKGGDDEHFYADDVDGLQVVGCVSTDSGTGVGGIVCEAGSASHLIKDVTIQDCRVDNPDDYGIAILGGGASASTNQIDCHILNCKVDTPTGNGIQLGTAAKYMDQSSVQKSRVYSGTAAGIGFVGDHITIAGCRASSNGAEGIVGEADGLVLADNIANDNTTIGISIGASNDVAISGNVAQDNTGSSWSIASATSIRYGTDNIGLQGVTDGENGLTLNGQITIDGNDDDSIIVGNGLGLENAIKLKQGGCPYPVVLRKSVSQASAGANTIETVPSGEIWLVRRCVLRSTEDWDGSGFALDVGISGGDEDGFYDASTALFNGTGVEAADPADQGALLFSTDALNHVIDATSGAVDIIGTVTSGTGSVGVTSVYLEVFVLKGKNQTA